MKIGPSNTDGPRIDGTGVGAERAAPVRSGTPATASTPSADVDRVSLSGSSAALLGQSAATPFDEKKVEEVRRAIAEGRFPVDARRVAEELLADTRDLIGLSPRGGNGTGNAVGAR